MRHLLLRACGVRCLILVAMTLCLTGFAAIPATAQTLSFEEVEADPFAADARLDELERQLAELRASMGVQSAVAEVNADSPTRGAEQTSLFQPTDRYTRPPSTAPPVKYPTVVLTGFAQVDGAWFHQEQANQVAVGDADDLVDFRRARLAAKGQLAENVAYMLEMDFAFPGRPSFMDVFLDVKQLPGLGTFRVGQWRQPFGQEALTSVKELLFLERSIVFSTFLPFRQTGIGVFNTAFDDHVTWAVSAYRYPTNLFGNVFSDDGYGGSARVTALPFSDDDANGNVHVGLGYTANTPATDRLRFRTPPEVGITALDFNATVAPVPFFVDTGSFPASVYQAVNGEFAASFMSLLFEAEVLGAFVNQLGGPAVTFSGAYAQAAYVLTGEQHKYNKKSAVFGRVVPDQPCGAGGCGAWELAARWSHVDLNDKNIQGGRVHNWTVGLNWYLNGFAKFQFNYIHPLLDSPVNGDSSADIFATRAHFDF